MWRRIITIYWMGSQSTCESHLPLVEIAVLVRCQMYKLLSIVTVQPQKRQFIEHNTQNLFKIKKTKSPKSLILKKTVNIKKKTIIFLGSETNVYNKPHHSLYKSPRKPIQKTIFNIHCRNSEEVKKTSLFSYCKYRASKKLYLMLLKIIAITCEKLYSLLVKNNPSIRQLISNSCTRSIVSLQKTMSVT